MFSAAATWVGDDRCAFAIIGAVRPNPFCHAAVLPAIHMGDYFNHWLADGFGCCQRPRSFSVNWFRKNQNGKFIGRVLSQNMLCAQVGFLVCVHGESFAVEIPA